VAAILLLIIAGFVINSYYENKAKEERERIVMINPFIMTGRVTLWQNDTPMEGVKITAIVNKNIARETVTYSDGYYRLELPPYDSRYEYKLVVFAQIKDYLSGPAITGTIITRDRADIMLYNNGGRLTGKDFVLTPGEMYDPTKEEIFRLLE
jgi:hypothetical protein